MTKTHEELMKMSHKDRWEEMLKIYSNENNTLENCVKSLIKLLDVQEESDSGRVFHPTSIGSCRVEHCEKINILLSKMRELTKEME